MSTHAWVLLGASHVLGLGNSDRRYDRHMKTACEKNIIPFFPFLPMEPHFRVISTNTNGSGWKITGVFLFSKNICDSWQNEDGPLFAKNLPTARRSFTTTAQRNSKDKSRIEKTSKCPQRTIIYAQLGTYPIIKIIFQSVNSWAKFSEWWTFYQRIRHSSLNEEINYVYELWPQFLVAVTFTHKKMLKLCYRYSNTTLWRKNLLPIWLVNRYGIAFHVKYVYITLRGKKKRFPTSYTSSLISFFPQIILGANYARTKCNSKILFYLIFFFLVFPYFFIFIFFQIIFLI